MYKCDNCSKQVSSRIELDNDNNWSDHQFCEECRAYV